VDRQERLCREVAARLGLITAPGGALVDNNRSAWQRNRDRPGWTALLEAIRAGRVRHVIVYHPDRLMRQPGDLEQLLILSEEHDITLHGQANRRDLLDPFFCGLRSRTPADRRMTRRAVAGCVGRPRRAGRPHSSGQRPWRAAEPSDTPPHD
jgi:site-specific DNA recombinase